jgi:hypothetical protein
MEMISRSLLVILCCGSWGWSATQIDFDMDGVPDGLDVCTHTPFLDEVNEKGCSVNRLMLPDEKENHSLDMIIGYGMTHNEDIIGQETQQSSKFELNYYTNNWIYTFGTGYFLDDDEFEMQDTLLSLKKRFTLTEKMKITTGVAVKLPTYDFQGNKTDYTFSSVINYYPSEKWALYTGIDYTFINDQEYDTALQNSTTFYLGSGYFISKKLYANVSYGYSSGKFVNEHAIHTVGTTLFYQLHNQWFTTLSYSNEIFDEDLHNDFKVKLGYTFW